MPLSSVRRSLVSTFELPGRVGHGSATTSMARIIFAVTLALVLQLASGCAGLRHPWPGMLGGDRRQEPPVELPPEAGSLGHFLRGEVAISRGDADRAIREFEQAVAADPDTALLRRRLATLYVRTGQLERALEQGTAAVKAEPQNAEGLELLAGVLSSLGRDDEATAGYERLLAIDPGNQEAYLYLAALLGK
ncbi:MAG: tetratricopeptide repeat protein, partial [Deltaproteobacteria bacterium]